MVFFLFCPIHLFLQKHSFMNLSSCSRDLTSNFRMSSIVISPFFFLMQHVIFQVPLLLLLQFLTFCPNHYQCLHHITYFINIYCHSCRTFWVCSSNFNIFARKSIILTILTIDSIIIPTWISNFDFVLILYI